MPSLPIPIVVALVLTFLCIRFAVRGRTSTVFLALVAACAVQSVLVSLAQYYGVGAARGLQAVTAAVIPPLAYLAFQSTARRDPNVAKDAVHLAGPVAALLLTITMPAALDVLLIALFAIYGGYILYALRDGADELTRARLEASDTTLLIWRAIAVALLVSALGDLIIAAVHATGETNATAWIVATMSSLILLALGALSLSSSFETAGATPSQLKPEPPPPDAGSDPEATASDEALMARLDALMHDRQMFRDPNLTLGQIARKMRQPVKAVSNAINRIRGENVSRYINGHRIRFAREQLRDGATVTEAMLASGFNTKSNFNREFSRVQGQSPTAWLATIENSDGR
ncbi:MAG: AraC family transcriptional regulator [Pseudomonadota bacterium]